jgi:hypothetical protein
MGDWWDRWCLYHCSVFGWDYARHAITLATWCEIFGRAGATAVEMHEATRRAAASATPLEWPSQHLAALQAALRLIRREKATPVVTAQPADDAAPPHEVRRAMGVLKDIGRLEG